MFNRYLAEPLPNILFQFSIETLGCCCGHGMYFPNVVCASGTEGKLRVFGCKDFTTRKDGCVESTFPINSHTGKAYIDGIT